jgi:ubiquinone/menaquinone biosynthesis C-methylase UbiE
MMNDMRESKATEDENMWTARFQLFDDGFNFPENISRGGKHLDFGCGFGAFAKILAEKYPHVQVYGIDSDGEKIEIGKRRYRLPNLHLLHSNKVVGRYSSCTAFVTLHEIADARKVLNDLHEHMDSDGRIMVYDFRKRSRAKYREWYERGKHERSLEEEYRRHNRWTVKQFENMCENSGFETVKVEQLGDYWFLYIGKKARECSRCKQSQRKF